MKHIYLYMITLLTVSFSVAFENIDAKTFAKLMKEKDVIILDVRTPKEFAEEGHIKGANLIPVQLFRYIYLEGLREKKVLVYCRSGNRSVIASKALENMGIKNVYNLKGGILEWKKAGLPIEKGFK